MKRLLQRVVFCFFLTAITLTGFSQGAYYGSTELTYTWLGGNTYRFSYTTYTLCEGGFEDYTERTLSVHSSSLGKQDEFTLTRQGTFEIVPVLCETEKTVCEGGTAPAYEKAVFTGTYTFDGEADDWQVYLRVGFLTTELTTLNGIDNGLVFYLSSAEINNTAPYKHSSPSSNGNTILTAITDQDNNYFVGVSSNVGYDIKYSLETPESDIGSLLSYKSGYSNSSPVKVDAPITISDEGVLTVHPTNDAEVGLVDLIIEEYDGNVLVGRTRRSIQINTYDSNNEAPVITGFNGGGYEIEICEGTEYTSDQPLEIKFYDPDSDDFIAFAQSPSFPFSGFRQRINGDTVIYSFAGTLTEASLGGKDFGTYEVPIAVEDKGCPVKLTTGKVFTFVLNERPEVFIGNDTIKDCVSEYDIIKNVEQGTEPYVYEWALQPLNEFGEPGAISYSTGDGNNDLTVIDPGLYGLTVTDSNGCVGSDEIFIDNPLDPKFYWEGYCVNGQTDFKDTSEISSGNIVSYEWVIQNPDLDTISEQTGRFPTFSFPEVKDYPVILKITDDNGCSEVATDTVRVCDHEDNLAFAVRDSCSLLPVVPFEDTTVYEDGCAGRRWMWEIRRVDVPGKADSSLVNTPSFQFGANQYGYPFAVEDTGVFSMAMFVESEALCIDTVIDTFNIHPRPTFDFSVDDDGLEGLEGEWYGKINFDCDAGDTIVWSNVRSNFTKGTPPIEFRAYSGNTAEELLTKIVVDVLSDSPDNADTAGTLVLPHITDSIPMTVDGTGFYAFYIEDEMGCHQEGILEVVTEIEPDFKYSIVCKANQEIEFEYTGSSHFPARAWEWDFESDGIVDATEENPTYTYSSLGDKQVTLTVTDSLGCERTEVFSESWEKVYNTVVDSSISFSLNPVCVGDPIQVTGIKPHFAGSHIDTVRFFLDDETTPVKQYPTAPATIIPRYTYWNADGFDEISSHTYTSTASYNHHPEKHIVADTFCTVSTSGIVDVDRSEFAISSDFDFTCLGNQTEFTVEQVIGDNGIQAVQWFFHLSQSSSPFDSKSGESSSDFLVEYEFAEERTYYAKVVAADNSGCTDTSEFHSVTVIDNEQPLILYDSTLVCANAEVSLSYYVDDVKSEGLRNYYLIYDNDTIDSYLGAISDLVNGLPTDDGSPLGSYEAIIGGDSKSDPFKYTFDDFGGEHLVKLVTELTSAPGKCRFVEFDTIINTLRIDSFGIQSLNPNVCAQDSTVNITTLPTPDQLGIIEWNWTIEDTLYAQDSTGEVEHQFSIGGYHSITVSVIDTNGCMVDVTDSIYVKDNPKIAFEILNEDIIAGDILDFNNQTILAGFGADTVDINYYEWDFGDGSDKIIVTDGNTPIQHEYNEIDIYELTLVVGTSEGCYDTLRAEVDLFTYLDLPTAFTPDGDGLNDEIGLVKKSIKELYDFKIFNRWGEIVFDADGDLDAAWDGTYKGVDQELGVYVVHIKGRDAYDEIFDIQRKVTLVR